MFRFIGEIVAALISENPPHVVVRMPTRLC
jgi:hypothetical protein